LIIFNGVVIGLSLATIVSRLSRGKPVKPGAVKPSFGRLVMIFSRIAGMAGSSPDVFAGMAHPYSMLS